MSTLQILNDARHEIRRLRRQNEILTAKVEVMDLFACVLHTKPAYQEQPMSPDVAYQIDQEIERLTLERDLGNPV